MRVCIPVTYFTPNISGLTVFAERLAEELRAREVDVTVVTNRFRAELPEKERAGSLLVRRAPVTFRFGKFVYSSRYSALIEEVLPHQDVVFAQLPMMPQELLALISSCRRFEVPLVLMYQCDIPRTGVLGSAAVGIMKAVNRMTCRAAEKILVLTLDYAVSSPVLRDFLDKCEEAPPLVRSSRPCTARAAELRARLAPSGGPLLGCVARFSAEKGIDHLLEALPDLAETFPDVRLAVVGDDRTLIGDGRYRRKIARMLESRRESCVRLGHLAPSDLDDFYAASDLIVLPSTRSPEAFGLVQIESMLCGTPVVASNLPGVRQPVNRTEHGELSAPGDSKSIASAVRKLISRKLPREDVSGAVGRAFDVSSGPEAYLSALRQAAGKRRTFSRRSLLRSMLRHTPPFTALVRSAEAEILLGFGAFARPVLDVGCEDGNFARYVLPLDGIAVDINLHALTAGKAVLGSRDLACADCVHLPFAEGAFKTIICNSTVEHIPDLAAALSELRRALHDDGYLYLTVPTARFAANLGIARGLRACGLRGLADRYGRWFNRISKHEHYLRIDDWIEILSSAGFSVETVRPYLGKRSHRIFDLLHFFAIPRLVTKKLFGRWVPFPLLSLNYFYEVLLSRAGDDFGQAEAPYVFFRLRKVNR